MQSRFSNQPLLLWYRDIGKTVTITNTGAKKISIKPDTWEGSDFTVSALSKSEIASGESATFTVAPKRGLGVGTYNGSVNIYIYEDAQQTSQINIASMSVTLTVEQGNHTAPSAPHYDVAVADGAHGSVTVSPKNASKDSTVTVTVTPDKGYALEKLAVTDKNGSALNLTDKGGGQYTFTMPSGPVTVTATFMDDNTMLNFFVDVPAGAYYYDAVLWAAEGGIVTATDAVHFSPDASCTRAQMVTMLYRFAKAQGMETTRGGMAIREFDDFDAVPTYALEAMDWAVNAGVLKGDNNNRLLPQDNCTRAQIVTMLYRALGEK